MTHKDFNWTKSSWNKDYAADFENIKKAMLDTMSLHPPNLKRNLYRSSQPPSPAELLRRLRKQSKRNFRYMVGWFHLLWDGFQIFWWRQRLCHIFLEFHKPSQSASKTFLHWEDFPSHSLHSFNLHSTRLRYIYRIPPHYRHIRTFQSVKTTVLRYIHNIWPIWQPRQIRNTTRRTDTTTRSTYRHTYYPTYCTRYNLVG